MKISPMDIQRQTFTRAFRGLDADEVRTYLNIVAEEFAALQSERDRLAQELGTLKISVDEHRERETILKNTLLTAQRVSEEIKDNARRAAEQTVKEAELQADRLLELAQDKASEVERSMMDLRSQRSMLLEDIRTLIGRVANQLDLEEEAELGDKLRFLRRREGA
jgi:cell division initiation protein